MAGENTLYPAQRGGNHSVVMHGHKMSRPTRDHLKPVSFGTKKTSPKVQLCRVQVPAHSIQADFDILDSEMIDGIRVVKEVKLNSVSFVDDGDNV